MLVAASREYPAATWDFDRRACRTAQSTPVRISVRKVTKQHSVDDAEHRGIRADAQRERDHDGSSESNVASEHACRVARVLQQIVDESQAPHRASLLFIVGHVAKRSPFAVGVQREQVAMMAQFFIQLGGEMITSQPIAQARGELSDAHGHTERITR